MPLPLLFWSSLLGTEKPFLKIELMGKYCLTSGLVMSKVPHVQHNIKQGVQLKSFET